MLHKVRIVKDGHYYKEGRKTPTFRYIVTGKESAVEAYKAAKNSKGNYAIANDAGQQLFFSKTPLLHAGLVINDETQKVYVDDAAPRLAIVSITEKEAMMNAKVGTPMERLIAENIVADMFGTGAQSVAQTASAPKAAAPVEAEGDDEGDKLP